MTFREDARLLKRTLSLLNVISPKHLKFCLWRGVIDALIPFIPIFMSGVIIDALIYRDNTNYLILYILIATFGTFILKLISDALTKKIDVLDNMFGTHFLNYLNELRFNMTYEASEDSELTKKRENIINTMFSTDNGIDSVIIRMEEIVKDIFSVIVAIIISTNPIYNIIKDTKNNQGIILSSLSLIIIIICVLVIIFCSVKNGQIAEKKIFDLNNEGAANNNYIEYYNNIYLEDDQAGKDVRIFNQGELIVDEIISKARLPWLKIVVGSYKINQKYFGINAIIAVILSGVIYLYVGISALHNIISVGNVIQVYGSITRLTSSSIQFLISLSQLKNNNLYLSELFDFIEIQENNKPKCEGISKVTGNEYQFEFHHVSFKYPNNKEYTLKNVSLTINPKSKIAIVGENGSGKTTFIKLLCRLYKPTEGIITLNGKNIQEYDYSSYLRLFSVVFQDFQLLSFSISENIGVGESVSDDKLWRALEKVGIKELVEEIPEKENQQVSKRFSDKGIEFSGGESQKIALARAIYNDSPIVILDEPTAALDPLSEYAIYEKFNEISDGKTAIFITHRLSSCKFCDMIIVFDKGYIVQIGEHDSLLENSSGKYAELWQSQSQYYNK